MARGSSVLKYGKIEIISEGATLSDLKQVLSEIIEKHGYPEEKSEGEVQRAVDEALKKYKDEEELDKARREFDALNLKEESSVETQVKKPWEKNG